MGWNSYDAYHGAITEKQFKDSVDVLAEKLLPHGWEYAVIDFCWFNPGPEGWDPDNNWTTFPVEQSIDDKTGELFPRLNMDEYGRLLPATNRFPSASDGQGFKAIGDYVHSKGMKFGIHIMRGIPRQAVMENTPILGTPFSARDIAEPFDYCRWNNNMYGIDHTKPGAQEYYNSLFNLYASWGVDYIKADDMTVPVYHRGEIEMMRKAIDQCGRPMVLSLSCGETPIPEANHLESNANLYRISIDFWDNWKDLRHNFDLCNSWSPHIGDGSWPDADMIPFGNLCLTGFPGSENDPNHKKREHESFFTPDEHQTLMSLWVMARSPLMWGGDPISSPDSVYKYLANDEVLNVLKESYDNRQLYHTFTGNNENERIWVARKQNSDQRYIALFNLSDEPRAVTFELELEAMRDYWHVRDLWKKEGRGNTQGAFTVTLPPHGSGLYLFTPLPKLSQPSTQDRTDFKIRDPFVLPAPQEYFAANELYYMYASVRSERDGKSQPAVGVYRSANLQVWHGPEIVFEIPDNFWGKRSIWAPEVHAYNGKYYLFATITSEETLPRPAGRPINNKRATQIFVSDSPTGPFLPFENEPHTPEDWMALDGTLWVEDGTPYMIFCHEWAQIEDGTMELVELAPDLSHPVGEPTTLFKATDADWVVDFSSVGVKYRDESYVGYITDGCYLYRTKDDRLLMIWSSFGKNKYAIGQAYSESGSVKGPWIQMKEPIFAANGGHGMIFKTHEGRLMLPLHQPNADVERVHFFELEDLGDRLRLKNEFGIPATFPTPDSE